MKKYFDWEQAFHYIWNNADHDGIWNGDAATLASEFSVSEDSAYSVLSELCDHRLIELVDERTYAITNWPELGQHD
jgi:hypothetical protein